MTNPPARSSDALDRRLRLLHLPTPVERADRLGAALGKAPGTFWVKRDDLTGVAGGGNKSRKLEFVVAEALDEGADCLVTLGAGQSNAARATAAVARRHGMSCVILAVGEPPPRPSGNLLLDLMLGAELRWYADDDPRTEEEVFEIEADRLRSEGRRPYVIPAGASTPLGALGYVLAADEIKQQVPDADIVVTATGSAGTQAGLIAGYGDHDKVLGIRVGTRRNLRERLTSMAAAAAEMAGRPTPRGELQLDERHVGPGYASHTDAAAEAMLLAARTEGLILDPVYTGKALGGLAARIREGTVGRDDVVVFVHSGGLPGLFADEHISWLQAKASAAGP
jgi:D-cysteine desulfhydrase